MKKKKHPSQVASQNNDALSILPKNPPKKNKAWICFLYSDQGITENDILRQCQLSSGRNYLTELERLLNIKLERTDEPNPDGIGSHYRYRIRNQKDAKRIIDLINSRACAGGYDGISIHQSDLILSLYPIE